MGGLGGSGIGALIAKNWFYDKCSTPIEAVADYHLPTYINRKTLVILNSYSGNTEETLSMFEEAKAAGCHIIIITSGGKLKELAEANNLHTYPLNGGYQPRMTIGFGLSYLLMIIGISISLAAQQVIPSVIITLLFLVWLSHYLRRLLCFLLTLDIKKF